ncbi:unnamed protein product [Adineta ricciae]|uniref:NAD(P)(+)--arginine ADP-ribosyltransferase n=1 Tax=Adineta ricciae TaxID=249248 RepID=A0A815IGD4_ADIRI|nr:unnamed protein product [Adineta ricciae]
MTFASSASPARIQWLWKSNANPFSKSDLDEWTPYADVENLIIEKAYMNGEPTALLDDFTIDFHDRLQISNSDSTRQRPVKRMERDRDDHHAREERFTYTPISPDRPFGGLYGWISPFIRQTVRYLEITPNQLPSVNKKILPRLVEKAANGIYEESQPLRKQRQGEELSNMLLDVKDAGIEQVWECCAYIYSLESFVYKKLNEVMRLIGSPEHEHDWRSKVQTLGPFCLLLWDSPYSCVSTEKGTVLYRGANLTDEIISAFKNDCAKKNRTVCSFQSFTSCSRSRKQAEKFGNVLFIMTVKHAFTTDLKPFSEYPDEEEELLFPGVCFTADRMTPGTGKIKYIIYLDLIQQHRRDDEYQSVDRYHTGSYPQMHDTY